MAVSDDGRAGPGFGHVALFVADLRAAESFYASVFEMGIIGREALGDDGNSYSLPFDKGWEDAEAAGVDLGFVALRHDEVVLALFAGEPGVQVFALGLVMEPAEIAAVRSRLPAEVAVMAAEADYLEFIDPFGLRWQISNERDFRTAGEISGRWLDV